MYPVNINISIKASLCARLTDVNMFDKQMLCYIVLFFVIAPMPSKQLLGLKVVGFSLE